MTSTGCTALVVAAGLLLGRCAAASAQTVSGDRLYAQTAVVTITDHLSAGQQEETISVFFAGHLAGTLHIDQAHPDDSFSAAVDGAGHIHYTLCGLLRRETPDGSLSEHRIDNGGDLDAVSGGSYAALTLDDRLFALVDAETGGGARSLTPGPACAAAVS